MLDALALEEGEVIGREALDAVARRDVAEAGRPEGEAVDEGLAEDDLLLALEPRGVEDAAMGSGEVEVLRCAALGGVVDAAAVDLGDVSGLVEDGDDQAADEMLVAGGAVDPGALELRADLVAGLAIDQGQAQAEGAIREADLEVVREVGMREAAPLEIREGFGLSLRVSW